MDINTEAPDPIQEYPPQGEQSAANISVSDIWNECLDVIRTRVNNQSFKTWFEPIAPLRLEREKLSLQVPSQFFCEWLNEHYFSLLNEVTTKTLGSEIRIEYEISQEDIQISPEDMFYDEPAERKPLRPQSNGTNGNGNINGLSIQLDGGAVPIRHTQQPQQHFETNLNPRYTFSKYINGDSNQFARAAAVAVANNPEGTSFNPLVIYGGVGLGKTHLVHAIGNHMIQSGK